MQFSYKIFLEDLKLLFGNFMIRWCSYCAKFIGEKEPYQDYTITHGLCINCKAKFSNKNSFDISKLNEIQEFFSEIENQGKSGIIIAPEDVLKKGLNLGLQYSDVIMGIIQPIMRKIGDLFEKKLLSIEQEHLFSHFSNSIINLILSKISIDEFGKIENKIDVILMCIEGNSHTIGIRFLDIVLKDAGIMSYVILYPLSEDELVNLIIKIRPKAIAISIALEEHLTKLEKFVHFLKNNPKINFSLKYIIGGNCLKNLKKNIEYIDYTDNSYDINNFINYLKSIKS